MVKYYNNPSGKSDKQAAHFLKQAMQDAQNQRKLEEWYTKITTPKPVKAKRVVKATTKLKIAASKKSSPLCVIRRYQKYKENYEDSTGDEKEKWLKYMNLVKRDHGDRNIDFDSL